MLCDCIVCEINDDAIQRRLLAEPGLTFKKSLEIAQSLEATARHMRELHPAAASLSSKRETSTSSSEINKLTQNKPTQSKSEATCYRCGKSGHKPVTCHYKEATCHFCGKVGHLKSVCYSRKKTEARQKKKETPRPVLTVLEEDSDECPLYTLRSPSSITLEGLLIEIELDTGAAYSLMSENNFRLLFPERELALTTIRLCVYSGEAIDILGSVDVNVTYKEQSACVPLLVVKHSGPNLLGRDWLQKFKLDWREIHSIQLSPLQALLDKYHTVFQDTLGTLQNFKAHTYVDPTAKPKYCKAQPIPYAVKAKVEEELDRLVAQGTLEPVPADVGVGITNCSGCKT